MAKKTVEIGKVELRKLRAKIKAQEKAKEKKAARKTDGLSLHLKTKLRNACREVWMRSSEARKIAVKRSALPGGYSKCEAPNHKGNQKVPKTYVDHIIPIGEIGDGFIERLGVESAGLMNLCKECHDLKTKSDNARAKRIKDAQKGFL